MNNTKWVVRKNVNGVPTGPVLATFDTAEEKTKYMTEHQNAWLDTVDQSENHLPYVELRAYKIKKESSYDAKLLVSDDDFYKEIVLQDEIEEIESYGDIRLVKFYDGKFAVTEKFKIENRLFSDYESALQSYYFEAECLYEYHKYEEKYNL